MRGQGRGYPLLALLYCKFLKTITEEIRRRHRVTQRKRWPSALAGGRYEYWILLLLILQSDLFFLLDVLAGLFSEEISELFEIFPEEDTDTLCIWASS